MEPSDEMQPATQVEAEQVRSRSAAAYSRGLAPWTRSARQAYLTLGIISALMVSDLVLRGIVPAFEPGRTDFSEVYASTWLWRHGQDFYSSALATAVHERLVGVRVQLAPIYPPTALVLLSPFTFLPWKWANFIWLVLGLGGVAATVFLLWRLGGSVNWSLQTMALFTFLLSFDPLHQAFHLGNVALLVVPLALWGILLAERGRNGPAGLIIGISACLKPQIGLWILLYYLLRGRRQVLFGALASCASVAAILLMRPVVLFESLPDYWANLHFWFAPGRPYGFTEGALPFHVNIVQILLYQGLHNVFATNVTAHLLFLSGLAFWSLMLWRARFRIPAALAIASLLALSFVSVYHSVADTTILTLALCWAIPAGNQSWTRTRIATCVVLLLMMLPGHSALMRLSPHIGTPITTAWWWRLFVARYFVWLLLALNITLLFGMWESAQGLLAAGDREPQTFPIRRVRPAIY